MTTTFTIARADLRRARWAETPSSALRAGDIRVRIDAFALTSNNVTYAAFGDSMRYWDFFPTGDAATGCVPVWGFADVVESRADGVAVGERLYGYWPMADEAVLQPVRADATGFVDGAPHRGPLPPLYNRYLRCSADPLWRAADESLLALLRPLYTTSFLIDDFLAEQNWFGAEHVLASSASSKTAYGLGHCLAQRRGAAAAPTSVGLTSRRNVDYTRTLGCWDVVVPYMSGDAGLRRAVHDRWQERLAYSCAVGGTHWQALGGAKDLAGPRPVLFFAPDQAKKRIADWGPAGFQQRLAASWHGFLQAVSNPAAPWLAVVRGRGRDAVAAAWAALVDGTLPAAEGHVLSVAA